MIATPRGYRTVVPCIFLDVGDTKGRKISAGIWGREGDLDERSFSQKSHFVV